MPTEKRGAARGRRGENPAAGRPGLVFISVYVCFCAQKAEMGQSPFLQSKGTCGCAVGMEENNNSPKKCKNSVPGGMKDQGQLAREIEQCSSGLPTLNPGRIKTLGEGVGSGRC